MSAAVAQLAAPGWLRVCPLAQVPSGGSACALVHGRQIALIRLGEAVYALDNFDPAGGANVLSRGIPGEVNGERVIASPLYKHHYSLSTGRCLEDEAAAVSIYPARIADGEIWVQPTSRTAGSGSAPAATAAAAGSTR
jgi:NAD(P)H-dependent nitrite reductase small subunit